MELGKLVCCEVYGGILRIERGSHAREVFGECGVSAEGLSASSGFTRTIHPQQSQLVQVKRIGNSGGRGKARVATYQLQR